MTKKLFAWLLVFSLVAGLLPLGVTAAKHGQTSGNALIPNETAPSSENKKETRIPAAVPENNTSATGNQDVVRYTVLLLDLEAGFTMSQNDEVIYTVSTPMETVKKAAQRFVEQISTASGTNYVAIVSYGSEAFIDCGFTTDTSALSSTIENLEVMNGFANMTAAYSHADDLLASADENAIKNVVMFTQGVPAVGDSLSSGKYTQSDCNWYNSGTGIYIYEYANAVYAKASDMMTRYNLYSIGLFQEFDAVPEAGRSLLEFAMKHTEDIQNKGYQSVDNVDDLEFAFGDVAGEIAGDTDPIIIVPGVMGSRLFTSSTTFNDSTRVWDPVLSENLISWNTVSSLLKLGDSVSGTLYPRPCENQQDYEAGAGTAQEYAREYGAKNTYKKTVDTLCSEFPDRPVYVFSYDWRKTNTKSAQLLAEQIDLISQEYDSKVDLVCHSMGGLVASSYFAQYGSEKIDKIITCGTPYEGAPKLLNSVLTKQVLDDGVSDFALWSLGGLSTETKASFDGVAQLTPTYTYTQKFPMYRDHWAPFGISDYEISYEDYSEICSEIFGNTRFNNAKEFQKSIRTGKKNSGYNVLYDYENAYFVIGTNHATISSIKFQFSTNGVDETFTESDLSYTTKGDGTVPFYSASIAERLSAGRRCYTADVNHTQTITNAKCLEWIADILRKGSSQVESDADENRSFITIRIACPVDVSISLGEETLVYDSIDQTVCTDTSFGRMDLIGENGEIKMFCVDTSSDYDILLQGTAEGTMDYAIRYFDAQENLVDERIFENVPLTDQTVITTGSDSSGDIQLEVDENGDGTTDELWSAGSSEWVTVPDNERIPMTGLSLSCASSTICVGESTVVDTQVHPANTTDRFFISYSSSNEAVATVSENGEVAGIAPGSAWITATASNGYTAQIQIMVRFTDVTESDYFYESVLWAVENGITTGVSADRFAPARECTRGQVVTFLWRAAGEPAPVSSVNPFTDVAEGDYYYDAVLWAVENGITNGLNATEFGPDKTCTRGQVVTFLYRTYAE